VAIFRRVLKLEKAKKRVAIIISLLMKKKAER